MEQQATPWRVFDAPANGNGAEGAGAAPEGPAPKAAPDANARATKMAIAGVAGAVAIAAVAVVVALSGSGGQIIEAPDRAIPGANGNDTAMLAGAGEVVVDVTGAVTKPGVYRLPAGSRVGDAIDAAGGFSPRVDADRVSTELNLAATLADGSQVHIPSRDDAADASAGTGAAQGGSGGGGVGGSKVNLNTASQSELEALPGIGPVTATKIIESRSTSPFASVDDLRERKLVGEKTFEQLQSLVTVG